MFLTAIQRRKIATALLLVFGLNISAPTISYALTGGPSQPELDGFQPVGSNDMVDLFTGDFSYNIPLFELPGPNGGYPFNLAYQSGISMDQEASWVGLGFTLNPGAINRQMRGLPDEFKGDHIETKTNIKPSVTVGLGAGATVELFGADKSIGGELSLGIGIRQNNYTGFGYSIDGQLGLSNVTKFSGRTLDLGLDLSLDSDEGVGISPSAGLGTKMGNFGMNAAYNSHGGFSGITFSHTVQTRNSKIKLRKNNNGIKSNRFKFSHNASISFANPTYTPQIQLPMRNLNLSAELKVGGAWWGVFGAPYVRGFYNEQRLIDAGKWVKSPAFGYMNYQFAGEDATLDINREHDGIVSKQTSNLAIPVLTHDIFSVSAQGLSASFRPVRTDVGTIYDAKVESKSVGGSIGVDVAPVASKAGANLQVNHSKSTSGKWSDNNSFSNLALFRSQEVNNIREPYYFKSHGEHAATPAGYYENLGGDMPVAVSLGGSRSEARATNTLKGEGWSNSINGNELQTPDRESRSQVIQPITNEQLMKGNTPLLPHFKIKYYNKQGYLRDYDRSKFLQEQAHHVAGYTATTTAGLRYVYGIPAYNYYQENTSYSANTRSGDITRTNVQSAGASASASLSSDPDYEHRGTNEFLKREKLPPYAHSYLLTSIVGPDYVDVTGDGVTEDDLGYWVRFTYRQAATENDPYKWRDPFSRANLQKGWDTDPGDDRGQYVYGEKEIWYLAKAETKTHIAEFKTSDRADGRGVQAILQDQNLTGTPVQKLDQVKLYTRAAGPSNPLKSVKFEYDYELCPGVYNFQASGTEEGTGKLTLKKLWFEYGNSTRGKFNPYEFAYAASNPSYDQNAYDRWGNYRPYPEGDLEYNHDFPYVNQDPSQKEAMDAEVSSWSLSSIKLPSGGQIDIDYESDDYAYVQHLPAMQMSQLMNPDAALSSLNENADYIIGDDPKIRFKLQQEVEGNLNGQQQKEEVLKYLDTDRGMIYMQLRINLRTDGEDFFEDISGYADIDLQGDMGLEANASGVYTHGYFYLKREKVNGSERHPFSVRAWQHVRTNQPQLANGGRKLEATDNNKERLKQIKSLGNVVTQVRQMFEGFYDYCDNKGWGREIRAGKSWVRLNSVDKTKYGGGLRVRQLTIRDNWQYGTEGMYGQVYDYTTQEGDQVISSGVAAYEPVTGGGENPLRYAKRYTQTVPLRADNVLFFEYPINESYYPGPQVGYSKVTVRSLPAAHLAGMEVKHVQSSDGQTYFPEHEDASFGTTGMTTHEYYTAKDFPVIVDETPKEDVPYNLNVPVPFLGNISVKKLASSQGYSIHLNDMHGKPKQISNYSQKSDGSFPATPDSYVKYHYASRSDVYQKQNVNRLTNSYVEDGSGMLQMATAGEQNNRNMPKYYVGREQEFFIDAREFKDNTWVGGASANVDVVWVPILFAVIPVTVFTAWPSVSKSSSMLRTSSTNKIIHDAGNLISVEAYDGGSHVITHNLKWDKLTGAALLTSVNNNFDDPVYHYLTPAYTQYDGMGPAYENTGLAVQLNSLISESGDGKYTFTSSFMDKLAKGDELLIYENTALSAPVARVVYLGPDGNGDHHLYSQVLLGQTSYTGMVVRSGRRNHLESMASSIKALTDPSLSQGTRYYSKTIEVPR